MAQLAGELEIRLFAEVARLRADMEKATSTVTRATKNIESAAATATKALGLLGIGISAVGFVSLVKGSIDAMDKLNDLSKSTGLTVEELAGLKVAAKQSGGDLDSIATSINKLSVEMGKAPEKFRALGVSAKDPLEAFKQLSDIFVSIDNPQQRAALGAATLGRAWAGAAPLLAEGSTKIGEMVETGTRLSGVTSEMARQADELNDKWVLLVGTGGLMTRMIGPLLPLLNAMADEMLKVSDHTLEASGSFNPFVEAMRAIAVLGSDVVFVFKGMGIEIGGIAAQLAAIGRGDFAGFAAIGKLMKEDAAKARAELDAFQKQLMEAGKKPLIPLDTPAVPVPGASAKVGAFLGTGDDAAAKATRDHAKAIQEKMKWLAAGAESQERYNQAILDAIEVGDKENARIREGALAMDDMIAEQAALNDADRAATIEKKAAAQASDLETLRASLMTEDEVRKFAYENDFNLLNNTLGMKKEAQEEYYTLMGRLIRKDAAEQIRIEKEKNSIIRSMQMTTWGLAAELLQQFAGESKAAAIAAIAINKGLQIAMTIQNTATAFMAAMAVDPTGVMAARVALLGKIQVAIIAATGFMQAANVGDSGAAPGTPANPISTTPGSASATASAGGGITTVIHLHGETFSRKQVKELFDRINEEQRDGGRTIVA